MIGKRVPTEVIEQVRRLAELESLSQAQIAAAMHMSVSKIAGIIARNKIKLTRRHGQHGARRATRSKRSERSEPTQSLPTPEPEPEAAPPIENGCWLNDLTVERCRYPYGWRVPYWFCGGKKEAGLPYCRYHMRLCVPGRSPQP